jgi:hypothetical protein
MWRTIRAKVFQACKIKPNKRLPAQRALDALKRIHVNPTETQTILELTRKAIKRNKLRISQGNHRDLAEDGGIIALNKEAEKTLGKRRANKFFAMCNDPYF